MVHYKLTYFNTRGRAELSRLIFAAAGVQYEDVRVEYGQWSAAKPNFKLPFDQIPTLEVDGVILAQSTAIARFLARRFDLAGKTDLEQARADMIVDSFGDINEQAIDFLFHEKDKEKQAEKGKKFVEERLPKFLGLLEDLLKDNQGGDGYLVGDSLTWADICLLNSFDWLSLIEAQGQIANYPKLNALFERLKALPKLAEWIEKRPKTPW